MKQKIIIYILAVLMIIAVAFVAGWHTGQARGKAIARQKCIDSVMENCEYICGVGADFYFPDLQDKEPDYEYEDESMVAFRKGDYEK